MGNVVTKEQLKKNRIKEEFEVNSIGAVEVGEFDGAPIDDITLYNQTPIPFKFLDVSEQLLLAVERVGIAEIRAMISPAEPDMSTYPDDKAEIYDYAASLTLNDGDSEAFKKLRALIGLGNMKCFHLWKQSIDLRLPKTAHIFKTKQELAEMTLDDEENDNIDEDFDDDEQLDADDEEFEDANVDDDEQLETEDDMDYSPEALGLEKSEDYVIGYVGSNDDNTVVSLTYDLYEPAIVEGYPVASLSVRVSAPINDIQGSTNYTKQKNKLVWEYVFTMHCEDNQKPKDSLIKSYYIRLRDYLRAISAYAGNVPSKL